MRLATGTPIDKLLEGGLEHDAITNVYGPAGSGKTNVALAAALACKKPVIYIDTEGSFSAERFAQLGGSDSDTKRIIFIAAHTWEEQIKAVKDSEALAKKKGAGLVVIDSLVALYRLAMDDKNFQVANKQLATQYSVLSRVARSMNVPVLVTNQVYGIGDQVEITSRTIAKYWSKTLVELQRLQKDNYRLAILRKHRSLPEGRRVEFKLTATGMEEVGKFSVF